MSTIAASVGKIWRGDFFAIDYLFSRDHLIS